MPWWIEEQSEGKTFIWNSQWGRIGQKGVNKDGQKGPFLGPTPYPYHCGSVELKIPHPWILEATSSTNISTIPIH